MSDEQKLAKYLMGDWCCPAPPVCTVQWDAAAWIRWIDSKGIWMRGSDDEGDQG